MAKKKIVKKAVPKKKIAKQDTEKVEEVFEVQKGKKKTIKTVCGQMPTEHAGKKQLKNYNKILGGFLIIFAAIAIIWIAAYYISNHWGDFEYQGVEFDQMKQGDLTFYHTSFLTTIEGKLYNYNVYLRNDPRELDENIKLDEVGWKQMIIINLSRNYPECDSSDTIALANFNQILGAMGARVGKDPEAGCDSEGRYMYLAIGDGNETKITKMDEACYNLEFKDCEIIEVTERLIVNALVLHNENSKK